ncbi:MAG TPA: hypothetical protein VK948_05515, partial [Aeromicrobium sp.]|nr:hypothetical protein [Aeromicrobium sp.]
MGTGLIVAFVVTVWAAYFVPLALRRYDEAHAQSALELLSPLSRVIRRSSDKGHDADGPDLDDEVGGADDLDHADAQASAGPRKPGLTRASARLAARRRRRVLLILLATTASVSGAAALSYLPWWSVAVPVTLLAAWLVACRVQVRSEYGHASAAPLALPKIPAAVKRIRPATKPKKAAKNAAGNAPVQASKRVKRRSAAESEDTVIVVSDVDDLEPERRHIMEEAPLEADALDEQLVIAVPSAASHGELVWDPLPVTLPTYVTKPRAGRTVRTIDFDAPGAWTSGHIEGE